MFKKEVYFNTINFKEPINFSRATFLQDIYFTDTNVSAYGLTTENIITSNVSLDIRRDTDKEKAPTNPILLERIPDVLLPKKISMGDTRAIKSRYKTHFRG